MLLGKVPEPDLLLDSTASYRSFKVRDAMVVRTGKPSNEINEPVRT